MNKRAAKGDASDAKVTASRNNQQIVELHGREISANVSPPGFLRRQASTICQAVFQLNNILLCWKQSLDDFFRKSQDERKLATDDINNRFTIMKDLIDIVLGAPGVLTAAIEVTFLPMISIASAYFSKFFKGLQNIVSENMRNQSAVCRGLRYYTGSRGESRTAQRLNFRDAVSGSDTAMRSEDARRRSFGASVPKEAARALASAGLFLACAGTIRCAFCQGSLRAADALLAGAESPMRAHSEQFATCPFLLGLDVGNEADAESDNDVKLSTSSECSECGATEAAGLPETDDEWRALAMSDGDVERRRQRRSLGTAEAASLALASAPLSLPPPASVRAAQGERAVRGIEALERSASELPTRHPEFARFSDRLRTLGGRDFGQPVDQVAAAGFFCRAANGRHELVVCFRCDLQLVAGPVIGDAWVAHAMWSPRCGHVLAARGAAFVRRISDWGVADVVASVVDVHSRAGANQLLQQLAQNWHSLAILPSSRTLGIRFRVEARDFRARSDTVVARGVARLGFPDNEVRVAMELRLVATGDDFASSDQLLSAVVEQREAMELLRLDVEAFREATLEDLRKRGPSEEPPESTETDWLTCRVCMDRQVNVVLLDCGHLCCCSCCSRSLQACPICRQPIRAEAPLRLV